MRMIALAVVLFALLPVECGFAQGAVYDLTVKVDATKAKGSPWDGIPGLGTGRPNINAAPDVAVCIVQATGKPQCLWRPQGRRLLSVCQNSVTCKFESVSLPPPPVGLLFIDIDVQRHDLVDIVILTGNATAAGEAEIESALRSAMQALTPALSEDAKERGIHKARALPLQQCAGGSACRLTQSEFRLDPKK